MFNSIRPTGFPTVDMEYIRKQVMRDKSSLTLFNRLVRHANRLAKEQDVQNKEFSDKQLHIATDMVIRRIFRAYFGKDFKKEPLFHKDLDNGKIGPAVHYEAATSNVCVSVFICNGSLLYIVTVYTINEYAKEIKVCYYDKRHMMRNDDTYLQKVLEDFSMLLYESKNLEFQFEHSLDRPPRGVFMDDGSLFYNIHENRLLKPKHYYAGIAQKEIEIIDHKTGVVTIAADRSDPAKVLPFDTWYQEIFDGLGIIEN